MNAVDVSVFSFLAPIFAFLLVTIVVAAVLKKSEIVSDSLWINIFVAIFVGVLFIVAPKASGVILSVVPWIAVLVVALFGILFLVSFMGKTDDIVGKGLGWLFVVFVLGIFLIAGINIFSGSILPYIPGPFFGIGGDPDLLIFFSWLYSPSIFGAFLLVVAAAAVSLVVVRAK